MQYSKNFIQNWMMGTSPTSQNSIEKHNFCKNCPVWLKFGIKVSFTPQYCPEKFCRCRFVILPISSTNLKADLKKKF